MVNLETALVDVLGTKSANVIEAELGLSTVGQLLRHYPRRYDQRGALTEMAALNIGDHVTVQAQIKKFTSIKNKSKPGTRQEVVISDGTGQITLMFFNQHWREKDLIVGRTGLFSGQISLFNGKRQLAHPEYHVLDQLTDIDSENFAAAILPVYSATSKLQSWTIQRCVELILDKLDTIQDPLPSDIITGQHLCSLDAALRAIHQPKTQESLNEAIARLKWDEAFALQIVLAQQKYEEAKWPAVPRVEKPDGLLAAFDQRLPFSLTAGQQEVAQVIAQEMAIGHPMHRLLQGEVGSGKTVLALRAMLTVVDSGGQAALLAPTEVLAAQHYRAIKQLLGPLADRGKLGGHDEGTGVTLLTGSLNTAARRQALLDITSGQAGIVIGTHALLEERVEFFDLGLVVIDEQHRFGVEQRATLVAKAGSERRPHVLVMTATPIPRTIAMTAFGALEISTLTELPKGRSPIATHVVFATEQPAHLERAWQRVIEEVEQGHQVYIVVPRISSNDDKKVDGQGRPAVTIEDLAPQLMNGPLQGLRVDVLHGQMSGPEKDDVMRRFAHPQESENGIDVLIATTVIEVGVDVPNATMMIIMDADRFGISQLHQLRGRVGRGQAPGLCLLVTEAPAFSNARQRLLNVASTTDGFALAALDLEQRHEGDVLGKDQSGLRSSFKLVSIRDDEQLLTLAKEVADLIVSTDPELLQYPALQQVVEMQFSQRHTEFVKKS